MRLTLREFKRLIRENVGSPKWLEGSPESLRRHWEALHELLNDYNELRQELPQTITSRKNNLDLYGSDQLVKIITSTMNDSESYAEFYDLISQRMVGFRLKFDETDIIESIKSLENQLRTSFSKMQAAVKDYEDMGFTPEVSNDEEAEAGLGKVALPRIRPVPMKFARLDPNTDFENELEKYIAMHVEMSNRPLPQEFTDYIKKAMEQGWYPQIFKEPEEDDLYRGITIATQTVCDWFSMTPEEVIKLAKREGIIDASITVKSSKNDAGAVSWTKNIDTAREFAWVSGNGTKVGLIFHAFVIDNPDKFWDLSGTTKYKSEYEVIALDPRIKIHQVSFIYG
jgi:hypothetical protein